MDKKKNRDVKWGLRKQADFFETLADMLNSGFSVKQCLTNLPILYPRTKDDFKKALAQLEQGKSFSDSIRYFLSPNVYYQLMIAENHGQLNLSIKQLGKYMRQRLEQREKIQAALFYPCILFGLLVLMISLMMTWMRPTIMSLSNQPSSRGLTMNLFMKIIIFIGSMMIFLLTLYLFYGIYWWKKHPAITRHQLISKVPIIGSIYRYYAYYYLSFNLGLLMKSGLDFREICIFLKQFESRTLLYQLGEKLDNHLSSGKEVQYFVHQYAFIPPELDIFLNKGQTISEISEDLLIYSSTIYQRLIKKIDRLINMIQPIAFLFIALIIIVVYLSILIPIYSNLGGMSI